MEHESRVFALPITVITIMDLAKLRRELEAIEQFAIESKVREAGKQPNLPRVSRALEETAKMNDINLLLQDDRDTLSTKLKDIQDKAPIIHMSFASEPGTGFLSKITTWFRNEVDAQTLLQVGIQPSIAAGCIVRTRNKYFDLSLRSHFDKHYKLLAESLKRETVQNV